jgi:hypothetical protein
MEPLPKSRVGEEEEGEPQHNEEKPTEAENPDSKLQDRIEA